MDRAICFLPAGHRDPVLRRVNATLPLQRYHPRTGSRYPGRIVAIPHLGGLHRRRARGA